MERHIGALRGRERQLVRQVEVVTAHQTCLLGTQQAGLMHGKGALLATRDLLLRCTQADTSTLEKIKVDDMDCLKDVVPVKRVAVQLDETALCSAISEFGSVQLPDAITHHPSPVIPAKVEEYEDDEHDVLHKSVAGAASGPDTPVRITVQFPRLSNQNWLAQQKEQNFSSADSSKDSSVGAQSKSRDITSWLSSLQLAGAQEDYDAVAPAHSSISSYDMLAVNSPVHTSESSSIEIVSSHYGTEKDNCSSPVSGMYEIENLHMCVGGNQSRWLNDKQTHSEDSLLHKIDIPSVCRANETCSSFNDCLCQNKCIETAVEKLQQSALFKMKTNRKRTLSESEHSTCSSILTHMTNIFNSENALWLLQKQDSVLPVPIKRAMYEVPGSKWLRLESRTPVTQTPRIQLATHSNIWLLHKLKSQKDNEKDIMDVEKCNTEKDVENNNEKEDRITTEALSEALKKITVDSNIESQGRSSTFRNMSSTSTVSGYSPSGQSWLLSKKHVSNLQIQDKIEEMRASNKKQWLSYSPGKSPVIKKSGTPSLPHLPEAVMSVAHAGIKSWLLKNIS